MNELRDKFIVKEIIRTGVETVFVIEKNGETLSCESDYLYGDMSHEHQTNLNRIAMAKILLEKGKNKIKAGKSQRLIKPSKGKGYSLNVQITNLDKEHLVAVVDCGVRATIHLTSDEIKSLKEGDFISTEGTLWLYALKFLEEKPK